MLVTHGRRKPEIAGSTPATQTMNEDFEKNESADAFGSGCAVLVVVGAFLIAFSVFFDFVTTFMRSFK